MSGPDPGSGLRLFARVEAFVPVRLRALSPEQACLLARQAGTFATVLEPANEVPPRPPADATWEHAALAAILARLDRLERRLDEIARSVAPPRDEQDWSVGRTALLSGSGIAVISERRYAPETPVQIELTLPGDNGATVLAVGRIVSVAEADGKSIPVGRIRLAIAFTGINPADREVLVHYSFRLQRAQLRERRGEQAD